MTDNTMREALLRDLKTIFEIEDPAYLGPIVLSASEQIYKAGAEWQSQQAQGAAVGWQFYSNGEWWDGSSVYQTWDEMEGAGVPVRSVYAAPPAPAAVPDMKWLKEVCTSFFYWWHNQPGANTQQGFDEWAQGEEVKRLLAALAPADPNKDGESD